MALAARSILAVGLLLGACSGHVSDEPNVASSGGDGSAGRRSAAGTSSGGAGSGGRGVAGGAGAAAGGLGGSAGADAAGTGGVGGAAPATALASLVALQGSGVTGMARFSDVGDHVQLELTLAGCAAGAHALHLHANASCDDDGNAAGGHWSPQGEVVPDVTCAADGSAALVFDALPGAWTIGAPAASDVLGHAVMLHSGPAPAPAARVACGIAAKAP